jgi:hypothetical protein
MFDPIVIIFLFSMAIGILVNKNLLQKTMQNKN